MTWWGLVIWSTKTSAQNHALHHGEGMNVSHWIGQMSLRHHAPTCLDNMASVALWSAVCCVAFSFLPSAVMPACSELQLWEMTFGGDLRELRFKESGGERCLTGTGCTEPRLFRELWTYIKCGHVCECSLLWITGKTSKHAHVVFNHCVSKTTSTSLLMKWFWSWRIILTLEESVSHFLND